MRAVTDFEIETTPDEFEAWIMAYLCELAAGVSLQLNVGVTFYLEKPKLTKAYNQDRATIEAHVDQSGFDLVLVPGCKLEDMFRRGAVIFFRWSVTQERPLWVILAWEKVVDPIVKDLVRNLGERWRLPAKIAELKYMKATVERLGKELEESVTEPPSSSSAAGAPELRETPAAGAPEARATPAGAQPDEDQNSLGTSPLQERPDWDGKKAKVLAWLEARKTMSAAAAAVKVGEAESSLKNWRKRMVKLGELGKGG